MTTRTKATVAEGIVSREQLTSDATAFRYDYEPGNMTCYEIWISVWEDGRAMSDEKKTGPERTAEEPEV